MPGSCRIDALGALYRIIIRGAPKIFRDDNDKRNFLERLGKVLTDIKTPCYACVLMDNHIHLLRRTGTVPIATVMRRLSPSLCITGISYFSEEKPEKSGLPITILNSLPLFSEYVE